MPFIPAMKPPEQIQELKLYFLFKNRKLLAIKGENEISIPSLHDTHELSASMVSQKYLGDLNGMHCFCGVINPASNIPDNMSL
jgi:NAD+ diphosphatase